MGYGKYGSGGSYSTYGSYSTRSSVGSAAYVPTSTSRSSTSTVPTTPSQAQNNNQQTVTQKITEQDSTRKTTEMKSTGKKKSGSKKGSKQKHSSQKTSGQKVVEQKSTEPVTTTLINTSEEDTDQKTETNSDSMEENPPAETINEEETTDVQEIVEENHIIVYTEGTFLVKKDTKTIEKTTDELKLEEAEKRKVKKQKDIHDMELQVTKHPKFLALQGKLNERLSKREGKNGNESKIKQPSGYVTYGLVTIKNTASFLELSLSNEAATLGTLEDIHDLLDKEFASHNVYKVDGEIGKFLLASKSVEEMINLAMKIQVKFNEHAWNEQVLALPMFRKLLRPEDLLNDEAVPLFNGPRLSIAIHSGEATIEEDSSGKKRYSGVNIAQVESIGKFAQGGQTLVSSNAWTKVQQSQLVKSHMNRRGVFKLADFITGCSLVEVTPDHLQERAKFYGAVCSHCAKGIQPWEKSFQKLQCTWHVDHFKCFKCGIGVGEGTYAAYQGLPHCHSCYLNVNPKPKCKKCTNNIAKDYINALGGYWHTNCFSCKQCRKRPTAESPLRGYKDDPYCSTCHDKIPKL